MLCRECIGTGNIVDAPSNVLDGRAYLTTCYDCEGSGFIMNQQERQELKTRQEAITKLIEDLPGDSRPSTLKEVVTQIAQQQEAIVRVLTAVPPNES